jgi:hypothetical protein
MSERRLSSKQDFLSLKIDHLYTIESISDAQFGYLRGYIKHFIRHSSAWVHDFIKKAWINKAYKKP